MFDEYSGIQKAVEQLLEKHPSVAGSSQTALVMAVCFKHGMPGWSDKNRDIDWVNTQLMIKLGMTENVFTLPCARLPRSARRPD